MCESEAVVQKNELKLYDSARSSGIFADDELQEKAFGVAVESVQSVVSLIKAVQHQPLQQALFLT